MQSAPPARAGLIRARRRAAAPLLAAAATVLLALPGAAQVTTGIDQLVACRFEPVRGRRIGLITNATGIDRQGVPTPVRLGEAPELELVCLFSPEHGLAAALEGAVASGRDAATGLPIHSLYGDTQRPTPETLAGLDTLVFDIQDVGARFYTYVTTMHYAMEAAAAHALRFVVLDRPNPINGLTVEGPVLAPGRESFVGALAGVPVRHGMTAGELALMYRGEKRLDLDLEVVRLAGWRRSMWFDQTGLPWVNPSPNMRNLHQALLYPGVGLLETTNLSVGRGTDSPFERIGAPWLDPLDLAERVNALAPAGLRCYPFWFTPAASKYSGERCGGLSFVITDRDVFRPVSFGIALAALLRERSAGQWDFAAIERLYGRGEIVQQLADAVPADTIAAAWEEGLQEFRLRRAPYLLYE